MIDTWLVSKIRQWQIGDGTKEWQRAFLKEQLPRHPLKTGTCHVFDCSIHAIDSAAIQLAWQSVNVFQTPRTESRQALAQSTQSGGCVIAISKQFYMLWQLTWLITQTGPTDWAHLLVLFIIISEIKQDEDDLMENKNRRSRLISYGFCRGAAKARSLWFYLPLSFARVQRAQTLPQAF